MSRQYFADVLCDPPSVALTTITATSETVLVATMNTPIGANEPRAGKIYRLTVGGTLTTGTAGTLIITPRYGLTIGGTALGASPTQNYIPSITAAPFIFEYTLVFRTCSMAASGSTCVGSGVFVSGGAVATAGSCTTVLCSSTASVTVDTTVTSGLWIGITLSVTPSLIPHWCTWQSWN
jgi:hypothetical protein